ncbi:hypothetical protein [Achromobacter sp. GD03932]|uniref:hypothetical protein n=1 Tax=Achromobacter sp. GD03932 TaxID=2975407 RepID=UPI00244CC4E2|nr:hypothetical protein [Achromobacter sp. GD03932]MDH1299716.1 hypothetical protein [Achromobacter sp. GD03932]
MTTTLPAGWKLVPIEPTEEMLVALGGMGWMVQQKPESYAAMLAAAPEAPSITVSLDPDPRGVSVGVWQGSHCIYNGAHAIPSSAPDAPLASMARAIFGDQIGGQMDAMAGAPAAGDALDAARYRWLREKAHQTAGRAPAAVLCDESDMFQRGEAGSESGFIHGKDLDDAIDAALAAQVPQQGEA